ncbi:MAG: chalcone isomerase family protein [Aquabacterium sp.]
MKDKIGQSEGDAAAAVDGATVARRRWLAAAMAWPFMSLAGVSAQAAVRVEGIDLPDSLTLRGKKLVLNGAGLRKRGYFKSNVVALYLPEKLTTPEAIMRLDGPRRIQLYLLRDFTSSTISRIFLADFKQAATEAEFKVLINEVAEIGGIYANIKRVSPGDTVNIDWQPGQGIIASLNDRVLHEKPIASELAYQIYLRMFIGSGVPDELRHRLLGLQPSGT